jgi:hypothetical protein
VDARSDLYALGCVLYELLTGAPPLLTDTPVAVAALQVTQAPEPPSHRNPQVGAALDGVVMTALAKDPARRYQTASAMGQDLGRILHGEPTDPAAGVATEAFSRPATTSGSAPTMVIAARAARGATRGPARAWWPLLVGVGLVLVLVVIGLWWSRNTGSPTVGGQAGPAATPTSAAASTTTTATTPAPVGVPAALANLRQVIEAGQRQGTIDPAAEDLLHKAEDATQAVQEEHGDEVGNKLDELQRKVDELIREGKISPSAAAGVRQAVAQLAAAVQRAD